MRPVPRVRERRRDDNGVYAILYGIVVVLILALVAVVVDIGMLRLDRRDNRAAADAAALAGSTLLGFGGQDGYDGCVSAMRYASATLNLAPPGFGDVSDPCAPFRAQACDATAAPVQGSYTDGRTTVQVMWPVPDAQLLYPDVERYGAAITQPAAVTPPAAASPIPDGGQCSRLGVRVQENQALAFAPVNGFVSQATTTSWSVALGSVSGPGDTAAPLVVLDPTACNALEVSGGSHVVVTAATIPNADGDLTAGVIAIDSNGTGGADPGTNCGSVISLNGANSSLWALDGTKADSTLLPGQIYQYALQAGRTAATAYGGNSVLTGCPVPTAPWPPTYAPGTPPVPVPPPQLCRRPSSSPQIGYYPWVNRYDCESPSWPVPACAPAPLSRPAYPEPRDYVEQWERFATGPVPKTWPDLKSNPGVKVTGTTCTVSGTLHIVGDVYSSCRSLDVKGVLWIDGGRFVTPYDVSVDNGGGGGGGCLAFTANATLADLTDPITGWCVGTNNPPQKSPDAASHKVLTHDTGNIYMGDDLTVNNPSHLIIDQAFTYLAGQLNVTDGNGAVYWVAPYATYATPAVGCTSATDKMSAPTSGCFDSLSLWAPHEYPSNNPDILTGGSPLVVDGTLFLPKAQFTFSGGASNLQQRAQLVARLLTLGGGGTLYMTPDPTRDTNIPAVLSHLIR